MATLTLVFDSPLGLPVEEVYGPELAALRRFFVEARRFPADAVLTTATPTAY